MGSIYAQFYLEWPQFTLNVDIHLPTSGITVLFGHSGSGKTTLLRCIAGLERPKQGQLIVNGTVWQNDNNNNHNNNHQWLPTHQRPLGYVFQEASLFSHLTVMGNLRYGMQRASVIKKQQNQGRHFDLTKDPVYDINDIERILPHRYPFLMVDKIIEIQENSILGVKNITMNEPQFTGHFPGNPVFPGVLQIEAMAQVGGIFALSKVEDPQLYSTYFMKIDKVKFKQKVVPGDTIVFELSLLSPIRRGLVEMIGRAYVNGKLVVEAEMLAQIIKDK